MAITKNTASVLMIVTAKMSRYDSRCVNPVSASNVITAPLCGSVSMPPLAMATTRCSTSSGMPAACAPLMKVSDIAASAMLMPPDADPVMPASELTDTAALTSGLGTLFSASLTTTKPGSAAMTPPKPYSDAVFIAASSAPPTASLVPSAKRSRTRPNAVATISTMPASSAPSTAQMPTSALMVVVIGACRPGSASLVSAYVSPYQPGISLVSAKLTAPTSTSGATDSSGFGKSFAAMRSACLSTALP